MIWIDFGKNKLNWKKSIWHKNSNTETFSIMNWPNHLRSLYLMFEDNINKHAYSHFRGGAMTFIIMTFIIMTFNITTLSITTFGIMTLSIRIECDYTECRMLLFLCRTSLCWVSLCWMSLCWMPWRPSQMDSQLF
jgi:hypothetical protein